MQYPSTFQVYNASAGSGKTFTLVKEYLKILLETENMFSFQQVLAITFTNKAANEMKERVLKRLQDFSEKKEDDFLSMLANEIGVDKEVLSKRSKNVLNAILQNYSAFYITTIDSFTYKLIKSFSFDLGLSQNFEVELNSTLLLNEAVEMVVGKIGADQELTNLLIDYSLEKTENDKSWDISRELKEFSKVLVKENDAAHFKKLSQKTLSDFIELREVLLTKQKAIVKRGKEIGAEGLDTIASKNLVHSDFYYSLLPKHFDSLSRDIKEAKFFDNSKLRVRVEENVFYSKSKPENVKTAIEEILPNLLELYSESERLYKDFMLNKLTLDSVVPLAVLNEINIALNNLKNENNIQLNAEFNRLISENIKEQPAPYIYERLGQKFRYYFIDEMQDTSVLQWENLLPLLGNALSQEDTGLMLVGDGKQAIYRWRGGKAEQFIQLGSDGENGNPFLLPKTIKELTHNYRSYDEIVHFNNDFFKHCASYVQDPAYKDLFLNKSSQMTNDKRGGYVELSFLEKMKNKEDEKIKYAIKVHEIIERIDDSFSKNEICVLVRKKKEGIIIANHLSEQGIDVVSSETLLIENSPKVNFIVHFLHYISNQSNDDSLFEWIYFLSEQAGMPKEKKHAFIVRLIHLNAEELFQELQQEQIYFDLSFFLELPFYEKVEYIIRSFQLLDTSDAYVQFFLDEVINQQKKDNTLEDFLEFWEQERDNLSIVAPQNNEAVQIMTVHKSKGLEFPVVIFPCDLDIYSQIDAKVWLDKLPEDPFNKFDEWLVPFHKSLQHISQRTKELYQLERERLELDNLNLLYVALTRAEEQLYVVTEKVSKSRKERNRYSDFFTNFLLENALLDDNQSMYTFGTKERAQKKSLLVPPLTYQRSYTSIAWEDHNIHMLASSSLLWGSEEGKAIDYGNLIHKILSEVLTYKDVEEIVEKYHVQGLIANEVKDSIQKTIEAVVGHEKLKLYFDSNVKVYNEREIMDVDKNIMVPDRLVVLPNKKMVILDYKTGKPSKSHHDQLKRYEFVLTSLGYHVSKKILIYINEEITIEEI